MSRSGVVVRALACALVSAGALAAAGGASAATSGRLVRVGPRITPGGRINPLKPLGQRNNDTVTSSNWSGYAVENSSPFTDVRGSWVQPAVNCATGKAQYSSFWGGLDGYASNSVEQLGTDSDCTGRNRPSYYAWYEMYPAGSVGLSTRTYPVKPGDTLSSEVSVSGSTFTLSLKSSEGWTFTTSQTGSGLARSSAELIAEAPEICSFTCQLAPLANFGTVNFSNVEAAAGGSDQPFSAFTADSGPHQIIAVANGGQVKAQPSALSAGGNAFSITWEHS